MEAFKQSALDYTKILFQRHLQEAVYFTPMRRYKWLILYNSIFNHNLSSLKSAMLEYSAYFYQQTAIVFIIYRLLFSACPLRDGPRRRS